jgi:LysM repeat protein
MKIVPRIVVFVVVLALCVMVLPVSAAPTAQFPNPLGTHTVKQGEWIYCIARAYKVSPWSIASANAIPWPYWVYPNQVLTIPADPWYNIPAGQTCAAQFQVPAGWPPPQTPTPTPPPQPTPGPTPIPGTCRYYHYVLWGQTLSGIAWYYGTTIQAIQSVNPSITNPNLIYAGSTLCIP